jgi:hypothetical protein
MANVEVHERLFTLDAHHHSLILISCIAIMAPIPATTVYPGGA